MAVKQVKKTHNVKAAEVIKLRPLQRFALFFFTKPRLTAVLAVLILAYGTLAFTVLMKREGFPAMNIPYAVGQAVYLANDPATVDRDVAKPISDYLLNQSGVKSVATNSSGNFASVVLQYDEGVDAEARSQTLADEITKKNILPETAQFKIDAAKMGFTNRGDDAVISLYNVREQTASTASLVGPAQSAAEYLADLDITGVKDISVINPIETVTNPATGITAQTQTSFERFGVREGNETSFYHAVALGVVAKDGIDMLKFDADLRDAISAYNTKNANSGYRVVVSASYARSINQQMGELQRTMLEGLLAVLVIGTFIIAFRASIITVLSMIIAVVATFGLLHIIGYSLNTIVLFSLILGLALIVDDTIIMVEAIDKERHKSKDKNTIITNAVGKVGKAMIAATTTATLSFVPLLFVSGVIGEFVRAVPVTIITALVISLLVALIIIPLLARYIMLTPRQLNNRRKREIASRFETGLARTVGRPMLWMRHSRKREILVGLGAILISGVFIGAGLLIASRVKFNIFPPTKDTNRIAVNLKFADGTSVASAESITDRATALAARSLGESFESAANYGSASARTASFDINLTDYSARDVTAPELVAKLESDFAKFDGALLDARTVDVGPPPSNFEVQITSDDNREAAARLAADIGAYLKAADIRRIDKSKVEFEQIMSSGSTTYERSRGRAYVSVTATYIDDDTSSLINLTKTAVDQEFTPERVSSYGLAADALNYDFGQESENQESFKTMLVAFPVLLLIIFFVLAVEFRSLLQPLIIFMAIPFSFFGIALGLYATDNPFSFFAMLGFFALIGLSIKNTILLTDYANQARAAGKAPVDAAYAGLVERFRPLVATSLTAVVSLVPLALISPFWQGLSIVLIGGLLSSTLLVITVFPYYYLGAEYLRSRSSKLYKKWRA